MRRIRWTLVLPAWVALLASVGLALAKPEYVKKGTRAETIVASLKADGVPTLDGKWYVIGPFDNTDNRGFETVYPPEKEIDLAKEYVGKGGVKVEWKEF